MVATSSTFHYVVGQWLGDPRTPPTAEGIASTAATVAGRHRLRRDVLSMPDKWEYRGSPPGTWHSTAWRWLVSIRSAKRQLIRLCREWYMHPNGQPSRVRVGVQRREPAGARLGGVRVYQISAPRNQPADRLFRECSRSCVVNFTWWVNRLDAGETTCSAAAFSVSTTSACSIARSRCLAAAASKRRPTPPHGWRSTARPCCRCAGAGAA